MLENWERLVQDLESGWALTSAVMLRSQYLGVVAASVACNAAMKARALWVEKNIAGDGG